MLRSDWCKWSVAIVAALSSFHGHAVVWFSNEGFDLLANPPVLPFSADLKPRKDNELDFISRPLWGSGFIVNPKWLRGETEQPAVGCSGTLIGPTAFLTAGHCAYSGNVVQGGSEASKNAPVYYLQGDPIIHPGFRLEGPTGAYINDFAIYTITKANGSPVTLDADEIASIQRPRLFQGDPVHWGFASSYGYAGSAAGDDFRDGTRYTYGIRFFNQPAPPGTIVASFNVVQRNSVEILRSDGTMQRIYTDSPVGAAPGDSGAGIFFAGDDGNLRLGAVWMGSDLGTGTSYASVIDEQWVASVLKEMPGSLLAVVGGSPDNPLLPTVVSGGRRVFEFIADKFSDWFLDPPATPGLEYIAKDGQTFREVLLPDRATNLPYMLLAVDPSTGLETLLGHFMGGDWIDVPDTVSWIRIAGIEDSGDFVFGARFTQSGFTVIESGSVSAVPEPRVTILLLLGMLVVLIRAFRRRVLRA